MRIDLDRLRSLCLLSPLACVALGACTPMPPAELSSAPADAVFVEPPPVGACTLDAFDACTEACSSRACLDWCGGDGCVDIARGLHECAAPGEEAFLAANPEPELEYIPPGPDAPEDMGYDEVTPASEQRHMDWEDAFDEARQTHWEQQCARHCVAAFSHEDAPEDGCAAYSYAAFRWANFAAPPPKPKKKRKARQAEELSESSLLAIMGSDAGLMAGGLFGAGLLGGGSLSVEPPEDFAHGYALEQLISRGADIYDAHECVPGLEQDSESETFDYTLSFDVEGRARVIGDGDGASEAAQCIRELLEARVTLPPPATRGLSPLAVQVHVAPPSAGIGGFMVGEEMDDMWGGEIGEAYGAGGLGLTGTGMGGGGTGEGTIGIGGLGGSGTGSGGGGSATIDAPDEADDTDTD